MSFLLDLFSALLGEENKARSPAKKSHRRSSSSSRRVSYRPGDVLSGNVEIVREKFAKVALGDLTAVVFPGEMADVFVSDPTNVLSEGQTAEFVLLNKDDRGWKASIRAAGEAKARKALEKLEEGDLITGRVVELKDRGVLVDVMDFQAWIPISELAWHWVEHPSEEISIGEEIEAEITRIEMPDGWLTDKRKRRARAIASIRACIPEPESPSVPVAFSGMPFKVWAVAKTPRSCDAVSRFVLEEIVAGKDRNAIATTTGLDITTLNNIHDLLADNSLAENWAATKKGRDIVEAIHLSHELNEDPIRGLFVSAAHPAGRLISVDEHKKQEPYPRDWPSPVFHKLDEETFAKATDEAIPESLLKKLVPEEKREGLAQLQEDSRLRVFLRRDGTRIRKDAVIKTPEYWLLAGLWRAFRPFVDRPYRPAKGSEWCQNFLMVRCLLVQESRKDSSQETVFFEPFTETLWCLAPESKVRVRDRRGDSFPALPNVGTATDSDADRSILELTPDSWCVVRVL